MNKLMALSLRHRSIAVVGMGKNTGKTVTVNFLISGATAAGVALGLTSTGRDGESADIISALPKPEIYLPENAVLATASTCLSKGSARLEILEATNVHNPLGEIVIARVRQGGNVEISGPERSEDLRGIILRLQGYAKLVIVDGAMDRVAASAPSVTDAAILATGAVVGRGVERVIARTAHAVQVLLVPQARWISSRGLELLARGKIAVQNQQGNVKEIPLTTAIDAPPEILTYLTPDYNCLLAGGALSDPLADLLLQASWKITNLSIVVWDGTRIFVEAQRWQRLLRRVVVRVAKPIKLIAVTVNPVAPGVGRLPGRELVEGLQKLLPGCLVLDPLEEG